MKGHPHPLTSIFSGKGSIGGSLGEGERLGGGRDDEGQMTLSHVKAGTFPGPGAPGHCMKFPPALHHQPFRESSGLGGGGRGQRGSRVLSDADALPCEVPTVPVGGGGGHRARLGR